MAMQMLYECDSPSFKNKLKSSICCFPGTHMHETLGGITTDDGSCCFRTTRPQTPRSPYSWLKSTAQEFEIKDKCWGLIGRKGKNRRRHNSADFRYDAASYSLNFEDDINKEDELPLNNFTSRLPATPDRFPPQVEAPRRVLVAWS